MANFSSISTATNISTEPAEPQFLADSEPVVLPPVNILASVIIVSYNSHSYLEACLNSVLETTGPDCEVILLDNASTDGSTELIEAKFTDPRLKLVRNQVNEGFAGGNNRAILQACGRYLVLLNPDTVVTPGWLAALLGPLQDCDESSFSLSTSKVVPPSNLDNCEEPAVIGLTTPRILMLNQPERINTCGNNMHYTGLTVCRGLGQAANTAETLIRCEVPAVSGACFAICRELWERLGGLDETFFTYLEDTDFSLRARLAGYSCLYVPDAVIYHDYTSRFSALKIFYLERNRLLLLLKSYHFKTLVLLLPALILAEIITWGYALISGFDGVRAKLKAYSWILGHVSCIRKKRCQTQQLRRASDRTVLKALVWRLDLSQLAGPALGKLANYTSNPLFWLIRIPAFWIDLKDFKSGGTYK